MILPNPLTLAACDPFVKRIINPQNFKIIKRVSAVDNAPDDALVFVASKTKNKSEVAAMTNAQVIIADEETIIPDHKCGLISDNPKLSFARIVNSALSTQHNSMIHPSAIIDPSAVIHENVSIGAGCVIGKSEIGRNTIIYPNVTIYDNVEIGTDCVIDSGSVIGSAGFGFVRDEAGVPIPFPQLGGVRIGNHVEIGANVCIDRGALKDTTIKDNVKIDNLSQIAHNVTINENTLIIGTLVAGSVNIGADCHIAGQVVMNQKKIGDNVTLGLGSVVLSDLKTNNTYLGYPALPVDKFQKIQYKLKSK